VSLLLERVREIRAALEAGDPVGAARLVEECKLADPRSAEGLAPAEVAPLKAAVDEALQLVLQQREEQIARLAAGNAALKAGAAYGSARRARR
jgi:hypothetical protein